MASRADMVVTWHGLRLQGHLDEVRRSNQMAQNVNRNLKVLRPINNHIDAINSHVTYDLLEHADMQQFLSQFNLWRASVINIYGIGKPKGAGWKIRATSLLSWSFKARSQIHLTMNALQNIKPLRVPGSSFIVQTTGHIMDGLTQADIAVGEMIRELEGY